MWGVDRADHILHYYLCRRKTVKWRKKFVVFLIHRAAINSSILFKKLKKNQNQKCTGYAFKDYVLPVLIKWEPQEREDKKDSADNESLALTSTAHTDTTAPQNDGCWRTQLTICRVDSENIKWFMFHIKKNGVAWRRCSLSSTWTKKGYQLYMFTLWCGNLKNSVFRQISHEENLETGTQKFNMVPRYIF